MLLGLHVKNLALIEKAEVEFTGGLNILTGETGAGKSILIGSVGLALGGKASKDMIRQGEDSALVELACALACGEKPEGVVELTDGKYVWLSYATVTQDNLADFRSP